MMKLAIATCSKVPVLTQSDKQLLPLFHSTGLIVEIQTWNDSTVDWSIYDVILIRTIWDYHLNYELFLKWLVRLKKLEVRVLNSIDILKNNAHKFYLKQIEQSGIEIVPTMYIEKKSELKLNTLGNRSWSKVVIKPAVSASSYRTKLFDIQDVDLIKKEYNKWLQSDDFLVQKFIPEIRSFGELSIIFFNRKYSHSVLKTAKENEFRVQSEYGGSTSSYFPDKAIIDTAQKILSLIEGDALYARIDGTIIEDRFVLMEIELIEPELFFDFAEKSREVFVSSFWQLVQGK